MYRGQTLQVRCDESKLKLTNKENFQLCSMTLGHLDTRTDKATLPIIELLTSQLKSVPTSYLLLCWIEWEFHHVLNSAALSSLDLEIPMHLQLFEL